MPWALLKEMPEGVHDYFNASVTLTGPRRKFGVIGEKQIPFTRYEDGSDMGDNEGAYSGDDRDLIRYTGRNLDPRFRPVSDAYIPGEQGAVFGSAHRNIFQMSFCDGSLRAISYSIDQLVHANLGIRNDGEVISRESFE